MIDDRQTCSNVDTGVQRHFTNMHIYKLMNGLKNTCHVELTWGPF